MRFVRSTSLIQSYYKHCNIVIKPLYIIHNKYITRNSTSTYLIYSLLRFNMSTSSHTTQAVYKSVGKQQEEEYKEQELVGSSGSKHTKHEQYEPTERIESRRTHQHGLL